MTNDVVRLPSEKVFQSMVVDVARLAGWRCVHFRPLRRQDGSWRTPTTYDAAGWPDLLLVRPPRMICAELKSAAGRLTESQLVWLDVLRLIPGVEVYCWTPNDWDELVEVLTGGRSVTAGTGNSQSPGACPCDP